jgi:Hypervirulence associated proteins TUDOR domain
MKKTLTPGDRVAWNSHGSRRGAGRAVGTIIRKLTKRTRIKGHAARATPEQPQYLVRSDNGGVAAHRPEALDRQSER